MSEFLRIFDIRGLPATSITLEATPEECAAMAQRFDLVRIETLRATIELIPDGACIDATGRITAAIIQSCAVSGEDMAVKIDDPVKLRFVPAGSPHRPDEVVELEVSDLDEIEMAGTQFDLGEALAQSLALAIDPFATGPGAQQARRAGGLLEESESGPFAALAALRKQSE